MKQKKKGNMGYAIFLGVYVLVVLAATAFLLSKLWRYAEEYEISRPNKTMDAYVEELNTRLWNEDVAKTISEMPHEVQSDEDCAAAVQELLSQGISYVRAAGDGSGDSINYALRCGTNIIGKVKLVPDRSKAEEMHFDMLPWIVGDTEFDFSGLYSSVEVTVPKNYTVTLNGVTLGSEYIVEDNIHFALLESYYTGDYSNLPVMVTYRFDHIIGELEPVIYDADGELFQIDETQGDNQFLNNCTEEEIARLTDFTERFALRYQTYASGIGDDAATAYKKLAPYIVSGSDLEYRMKIAQDGLSWAHTYSIEVESTVLNSVVSFGGGVYLCDYSSEFTTKNVNGTQNFITNAKIIVIDNNGDLRVEQMDMYE